MLIVAALALIELNEPLLENRWMAVGLRYARIKV